MHHYPFTSNCFAAILIQVEQSLHYVKSPHVMLMSLVKSCPISDPILMGKGLDDDDDVQC